MWNPDQERDYAEAVGRIREAAESGSEQLDLSKLGALPAIPPEIGGLPSLQSLDLSSCWQVGDLAPLAGLGCLQSLDLSWCRQVCDLAPLASLSSLQSLNLAGCEQVCDLAPLAGLSSLQSLDLVWCYHVGDLAPLAGLSSLQSLDLSECGQVGDLAPLAGLSLLQSLNLYHCGQVGDLAPLAGLSSLQSLNLPWCKQVSDLAPLAGLASLQWLNLSGCELVSDLSPLAALVSLQSLNLSGCRQGLPFAALRPLLPTLTKLILFESVFQDLDTALGGGKQGDNVLDNVRVHYADLDLESAVDNELKVFVLGNGSAGKSQLCRRLRGLPFDDTVPSPHGVQVTETTLDFEGGTVRLNLWDFGGQEIYHGSHALFLKSRAIFLVVWTPRLESGERYEENGIPMQHRKIPYWLDYVRAFAGDSSRVVLVQSQCDGPELRVRRLEEVENSSFAGTPLVQFSAKTDLGLESLKAAIQEAVRDLRAARPAVPIGAGRVRVRNRLRRVLQEEQELPALERRHRLLERAEFDLWCAEEGVADPEALLDFLHHSGAVYHRPALFDGRIVLDQNWALAAIYAVLDRGRTLPALRESGRFVRADLDALVWQDHPVDEQMVFLEMMKSCGICFRKLPAGTNKRGDPWEYVVPELLPEGAEAKERLLAGRADVEPGFLVEARYPFLHEGVLRIFFSRIGWLSKAGAAVYWKYGCWFCEKTTRSSAMVEGVEGAVRISGWGPRGKLLVDAMVKGLSELPLAQKPLIVWLRGAAESGTVAGNTTRSL